MNIHHDRRETGTDSAYLRTGFYEGMQQGTDGYPQIDVGSGDYYISGGKRTYYFKATHLEFYGVNLKETKSEANQ